MHRMKFAVASSDQQQCPITIAQYHGLPYDGLEGLIPMPLGPCHESCGGCNREDRRSTQVLSSLVPP
jgi:hypothetical protein